MQIQVFGIQAVFSHQQISKRFPAPGKNKDTWGQMNPGVSAWFSVTHSRSQLKYFCVGFLSEKYRKTPEPEILYKTCRIISSLLETCATLIKFKLQFLPTGGVQQHCRQYAQLSYFYASSSKNVSVKTYVGKANGKLKPVGMPCSFELAALALQKAWIAAEQCTQAKILQRNVSTYKPGFLKSPMTLQLQKILTFPANHKGE